MFRLLGFRLLGLRLLGFRLLSSGVGSRVQGLKKRIESDQHEQTRCSLRDLNMSTYYANARPTYYANARHVHMGAGYD